MDDAGLRERLLAEMRDWYRILGASSPGAHVVDGDGVLACVVPAAPLRSYPNGVVYDRAAALAGALDGLAAEYAAAGVRAWTVWVPHPDPQAVALLQAAGHALDAEPTAMGRELDGVSRPQRAALEDWTRAGDAMVAAALNDRAYELADPVFVPALSQLPRERVRVYVASRGGRPASCLVTADRGDNVGIEMVATEPEARGRGLAGALLAHALADAAERGCRTTTLVATKLGLPVYERLGYRPLGTLQMWERRTG